MFFTHRLRYPSKKAPLVELGRTQESEPPWRQGKSLVFRKPFSVEAVAVGFWTGTGTEDDWHSAAGTRLVGLGEV